MEYTARLPQATVSTDSSSTLKKTLVLWQVVMIGLAYMQPMTVYDTFGIVSKDSGGHVPTSYIVALIAMLFTALSYGKMVRRYPSAGSAYTYTQRSINKNLGFMVGWCSLLDYLFNPMINILLATIYLHALFPNIPVPYFVVGLSLMMTVINLKGVELVANFNGLIVFFQMLLMVVFLFLVIQGIVADQQIVVDGIVQPRPEPMSLFSLQPFISEDMKISPILMGATILCFSFLGFDGLSSLSEETKDAENVIPKAILLTTLIGGVVFIITTYFLQIFFPDASIFKQPDESQPEILLYVAGKAFQSFALTFSIITVFASGLAAHTGVSRLMYVMGRDGAFPKKGFAYIHPKWRTPSFNVILVGIISLSACFFNLEIALHLVNFGALTAFTFVNLSVIFQYYIKDGRRVTTKDHFLYLVLPLCGAISIGVLWYYLSAESLKWGLSWAALGAVYLGFLLYRKRVQGKSIPALREREF